MNIVLNHSTNEESNIYLRRLYANLRKVYGKCVWQFQPHKDSQKRIIDVGNIDIGVKNHTLSLSIKYNRRGVIKELNLNCFGESNAGELECELFKIASNLDSISLEEHYFSTILTTSSIKFGDYQTSNISLCADKDNTSILTLKVSGFDSHDAQVVSGTIIKQICDYLSICINGYVQDDTLEEIDHLPSATKISKLINDPEWIDDHPYVNDFLALSARQLSCIDKICEGEFNRNYLDACSHFNNAAFLLQDYKINNGHLVDTANVLYISALEVLTQIKPNNSSTCNECGQKIYSIRKQVIDLLSLYLPAHVVKSIDTYYQNRSKYLHTGSRSSLNSYYGVSIPQLNPNSETGCHWQTSINSTHLKDFTSFVFRKINENQELTNG